MITTVAGNGEGVTTMQTLSPVASIADVGEQLTEASRGTWDALIEPAEITLVQGRVVSPRLYRYEYPTGLSLTPWATGQLCQFLGMPTAYFRRCPPELQDTQCNHWLEERVQETVLEAVSTGKGKTSPRWLLRARGDVLRGVLTERYVRLDHLELFAALSPALAQSGYEVDWFALTDESLHLRLHDASRFRDALPGDRLMAGVHIGNSEVGKRAVTVDALVYRVICTNGLIQKVDGGSLLHQRHIALSRPEFLLSVQTAVREAFAQSECYLTRLSAAVAHPIGDMDRAIRKLAGEWGLSQGAEEAVKAAVLSEHRSQHETLYGLVNGLTAVARTLSPDERYTLEANAGRLLESRFNEPSGGVAGSVTDSKYAPLTSRNGANLPPLYASGREIAVPPRQTELFALP